MQNPKNVATGLALIFLILISCSETTAPATISTVTVTATGQTVQVGDSLQLTATSEDSNGRIILSEEFSWSSEDEDVATVSADGVVIGEREGRTLIAAEADGVSGTFEIEVTRAPTPELSLELVTTGLTPTPAFLTAPQGDSRLFVAGLDGKIWIVEEGQIRSELFLDLRSKVAMAGEMGFFSLAFHPEYESNGFFYVNYTNPDGEIQLERYSVSSDPNRADQGSATLIMSTKPPGFFHFGGLIKFGPDGKLYIGIGDGGIEDNAQDRSNLLGKLLRIDVDAGDPYSIPVDNPYSGEAGARGEIWTLGLRNPWRWSFDSRNELIFIGDVGGNNWEEINVIPAEAGGANLGWPLMEGALCKPEWVTDCNRAGLTLPAVAYPHGERGTGHPWGCSVTGGYVYDGSSIRALRGHYFYADYCRGWVRSVRYENGTVTAARDWPFPDTGRIISFGEDGFGELYILSATGSLYRIVATND